MGKHARDNHTPPTTGIGLTDIISIDDSPSARASFESLLTRSIRYVLRSILYFSNDTADAVCLFVKFDHGQQVRVMPMFRYGRDLLSIDEASAITGTSQEEIDNWVGGFLGNYITKELIPLFNTYHKAVPESVWCFYDLTEEQDTGEDAQHTHLTWRTTDLVPEYPTHSSAAPYLANECVGASIPRETGSDIDHGDIDDELHQWVHRTMKVHLGLTESRAPRGYSN